MAPILVIQHVILRLQHPLVADLTMLARLLDGVSGLLEWHIEVVVRTRLGVRRPAKLNIATASLWSPQVV